MRKYDTSGRPIPDSAPTVNGIDLSLHNGLVFTEALKAANKYGGDIAEWIGPAWMGLHDAARTFKPDKGCRFSTHAIATIKWKMYDECRRRRGMRKTAHAEGGWISQTGEMAMKYVRDSQRRRQVESGLDETGEILLELAHERIGPLNDKQRETLELLARGYKANQISRILGVSKERACQLVGELREMCGMRARKAMPKRARQPAPRRAKNQTIVIPDGSRSEWFAELARKTRSA